MLSENEENQNFRHFCCKLDELLPTLFPTCVLNALLFQLSGQWKFFILRAILWFEQNMGKICQKTCLFVQWILGSLRPIPTKNCNDIFKIAYWIPIVVLVEPLKLFMQCSSSKIVQKTA